MTLSELERTALLKVSVAEKMRSCRRQSFTADETRATRQTVPMKTWDKLRKLGLIETRPGYAGALWLTAAGRAALDGACHWD